MKRWLNLFEIFDEGFKEKIAKWLDIIFSQQMLTIGQQRVDFQNLHEKLIWNKDLSHFDQNWKFFGKKMAVNPWKIYQFSKIDFPKIFQKNFPNLFGLDFPKIFQNIVQSICTIFLTLLTKSLGITHFHQNSSNLISASFQANFTFESAKDIYISRTFHFLAFHSHHIHLPVYGIPLLLCTGYLCVIW